MGILYDGCVKNKKQLAMTCVNCLFIPIIQSNLLRSAGVCHKILRISKEMFVLEIETQDVVLRN